MQQLDIKPIDAKAILEQGHSVLIDVREEAEWRNMHIKGAVFLPLSIYFGKVSNELIEKWVGKNIIIYCHLGVRSLHFAKQLQSEHPDIKVYSLTGGIVAWHNDLDGYKIITGTS